MAMNVEFSRYCIDYQRITAYIAAVAMGFISLWLSWIG